LVCPISWNRLPWTLYSLKKNTENLTLVKCELTNDVKITGKLFQISNMEMYFRRHKFPSVVSLTKKKNYELSSLQGGRSVKSECDVQIMRVINELGKIIFNCSLKNCTKSKPRKNGNR